MRQQLNLSDVNWAPELQDEFLRKNAKALAVPTDEVRWVLRIRSQLVHRVCCVLTLTVENLVGE